MKWKIFFINLKGHSSKQIKQIFLEGESSILMLFNYQLFLEKDIVLDYS